MQKYAKIVDEEARLVDIGTGTDVAFYASIGMTLMDVEQGYDGAWYVAGYAPVKPQELVEAELQTQYTALIQSMLDKEAQKLGYDNCNSVCTYVDTGVQKFDDEGRAFRAWRSAVWAKGYEILADVQSGKMEIPTEEELINLLPTLEIVYTGTDAV